MVADASVEGFGMGIQYPDMVVEERDGLWNDETAVKSSNYREALNVANHLNHNISSGRHDSYEVWSATDNAVWSAVCNKGLSTARHLFLLLVDIKLLCYEHNVFLHPFHISGNRMIATGIDGLSRGDRNSGIALGYDIRDFVPLGMSAFDYPGNQLETWCKGWTSDDFSAPLKPEGWFSDGHMPGVHIWAVKVRTYGWREGSHQTQVSTHKGH